MIHRYLHIYIYIYIFGLYMYLHKYTHCIFQDLNMDNHVDTALDEVPSASAPAAKSGNSQCDTGDTVDGRNPARLFHYLQDFIHPRWCRISEPSAVCTTD